VQTRLGLFVECVLTAVLVVCLAGCSNTGPEPSSLPTPGASAEVPSRTASPSPSAEELNLRKAERAVYRFWRVIDRLSADQDSDLTSSRRFPGARWRPRAKNINQDRYVRVRSSGNVVVRDGIGLRARRCYRSLSEWEATNGPMSVVEYVPADRASTSLVIEDQFLNLRGSLSRCHSRSRMRAASVSGGRRGADGPNRVCRSTQIVGCHVCHRRGLPGRESGELRRFG
jgi:hypothetical protein